MTNIFLVHRRHSVYASSIFLRETAAIQVLLSKGLEGRCWGEETRLSPYKWTFDLGIHQLIGFLDSDLSLILLTESELGSNPWLSQAPILPYLALVESLTKCGHPGLNNVPSKFMSTKILEIWLYLEIGSYKCNQLRSYWISMGPKTHDWCPYTKAIWR